MKEMQIRRAERTKAKLRIGISGPSGSGKTYSALLLAHGMVGDWSKIVVIDTEKGSGELYSHLGEYNVVELDAPFSPERYIEAITMCEQAGMEVIIIDSASHEWDGEGGCLEINEKLAQAMYKGNTWSAWSKTTPRHQKFIQAITGSDVHVITTARSKTETVMTDDKKVKKVGMKEIQREGWEYELTVNFTLDRDAHLAIASKDRTGIFSENEPFTITRETGRKLMEWAQSGKEPEVKVVDQTTQKQAVMAALKDRYPELTNGEAVAKIVELTGLDPRVGDLEEIHKRLVALNGVRGTVSMDDKIAAASAK